MRLLLRDGALDELAERQHDVATRAQLAALGITARTVEAQLVAERWRLVTPTVVLLANAATSADQLLWVAILNAPQPAALASSTALQLHGMTGSLVHDATVHLLVRRETMTSPVQGVRVHESRRFDENDLVTRNGLSVCRPERAAVDAAAWQRNPRFVYALLPAVVQQRIGTVSRLRSEVEAAGRVRHVRHMRTVLDDITAGAGAVSEVDLLRACQAFRLQPPRGQRRRSDASGRVRYLDAEWRRPDGRLIVLEVDGSHHFEAEHWEADMKRERRVVLDEDRIVLRCTSREIRFEPGVVAADLRAAGVPAL